MVNKIKTLNNLLNFILTIHIEHCGKQSHKDSILYGEREVFICSACKKRRNAGLFQVNVYLKKCNQFKFQICIDDKPVKDKNESNKLSFMYLIADIFEVTQLRQDRPLYFNMSSLYNQFAL